MQEMRKWGNTMWEKIKRRKKPRCIFRYTYFTLFLIVDNSVINSQNGPSLTVTQPANEASQILVLANCKNTSKTVDFFHDGHKFNTGIYLRHNVKFRSG